MNTVTDGIKQDAANLITWLRLPSVIERQPDAPVMASWLEILLTSVTPDADELLADEIAAVERIIRGAA
jgi:hypothetical protein